MDPQEFHKLIDSRKVVVDLGTGDGLWVYRAARKNPNHFYLGIDSNARPLAKISERILRRPAKGGAPNLLYLLAAVESLPPELNGVAEEVHILFPWGSLLRAVASGERKVLEGLASVCRPNATIKIIIGFDPVADKTEFDRLGISSLSLNYVNDLLISRYHNAGWEVRDARYLTENDWAHLMTSWAQRLRYNKRRTAVQLCCTPARHTGKSIVIE